VKPRATQVPKDSRAEPRIARRRRSLLTGHAFRGGPFVQDHDLDAPVLLATAAVSFATTGYFGP